MSGYLHADALAAVAAISTQEPVDFRDVVFLLGSPDSWDVHKTLCDLHERGFVTALAKGEEATPTLAGGHVDLHLVSTFEVQWALTPEGRFEVYRR